MFRNKKKYKKHLEGLSYEELLGSELVFADVVSRVKELVIEKRKEMDEWMDAYISHLLGHSIQDLLGHDHVEQLAEKEIAARLEAFESGVVIEGLTESVSAIESPEPAQQQSS